MPTVGHNRDKRISLRLTAEQKDLIVRGAALETAGDLSAFVKEAAMKAARSAIQEYGVSVVTAQTRERFYSLLLNPPDPSPSLVALMSSGVPEGFEIER